MRWSSFKPLQYVKQAGEPARPLIREALQILHRLELSGVGATEVILRYH